MLQMYKFWRFSLKIFFMNYFSINHWSVLILLINETDNEGLQKRVRQFRIYKLKRKFSRCVPIEFAFCFEVLSKFCRKVFDMGNNRWEIQTIVRDGSTSNRSPLHKFYDLSSHNVVICEKSTLTHIFTVLLHTLNWRVVAHSVHIPTGLRAVTRGHKSKAHH